ncbi:MAG: TetR/AcrR family transcriptional regulator [Galactobacter sp.]|uniref:TetR/AcrR family transcriptional regulator n=1 Tax=Galactobacter sp. TaxID=2676125 RepID=UPI0025B828FC|nr:TetR/AcrR family transcriptional regulator [Galactobacter sp.]
MPKIVDHGLRRKELMDSAWRVIARRGLSGATMREVAAEAGFANGALKPYFPSKRDLMSATYSHVFERTNERVSAVVARRRGFAAVLAFAREVLPLDQERLDEARAVIAFWQEAMMDPALADAHEDSIDIWRGWLGDWLRQAQEDGATRVGFEISVAVPTLLSFLLGAQVRACLDSRDEGLDALEIQLEALVDGWRSTREDHTESLPV